jgi:hypothetical protein
MGYPQTPAQKSDSIKSFLSKRAIESSRKSEGTNLQEPADAAVLTNADFDLRR